MNGRSNTNRKISRVGTGLVGSSFAYALMIRRVASELVVVDVDSEKALGEAIDLDHGLSFTRPMKITAGGFSNLAGVHAVVIAAGASQKPGETRLDLLAHNAAIFRDIVPQVVKHNPGGIIIVATNPVDILSMCRSRYQVCRPSRSLDREPSWTRPVSAFCLVNTIKLIQEASMRILSVSTAIVFCLSGVLLTSAA